IRDLTEGMRLEGVITNVANFGAFVDIGVGQDGLVHISELSNQFVRDPREHVRVGQAVNVHVLEVDIDRQRISLSMRGPAQTKTKSRPAPAAPARSKNKQPTRQKGAKRPQGAMAEAFARLKKKN